MGVSGALFHLAVILALSYYLQRKYAWKEWIYWPALVFKLVAGICLGLLYQHYFEVGDTFVYFNDGSRLANLARESFGSYLELMAFNRALESSQLLLLEPRALFFIKITSVLNLVTGDNYWAISLYYSFLSFVAAAALVRVISRHVPTASFAAIIAFLFFPSIVFWTSGVLKESIAMGAMFFLTAVFLKIWFRNGVASWEVVLSMVAVWVFWKLKYYYAGVFIPIVVTALFHKFVIARRFRMSGAREVVAYLCLLVLPLTVVTTLHPNFNIDRLLMVIVSNNAVYNALSHPGEYVQFYELTATPGSVLLNSPWALFSGLFRPLVWEGSSLVQVAQGLENTVLLVLFLAALVNTRLHKEVSDRLLVLALIVFVIGTCVLITLSAPNFGTLSRYRVGYLSFFAFLVISNSPLNLRHFVIHRRPG